MENLVGEYDALPEAASDVEESFDVNGEVKRDINYYEEQIPWDPKPQELGSEQPISVT